MPGSPEGFESREQLGELLVRHGVVTPEQLVVALERQRVTGQPLGRIIVELGLAPGPMVAQALATQRGGLVKTEYGFATGWRRRREALDSERADTIVKLREWITHAQTAIASRDNAIQQLRAQLAQSVETGDAELARIEAELVQSRIEVEAANAQLAQLQLELRQSSRRVATQLLAAAVGAMFGGALFGVIGGMLGAVTCCAVGLFAGSRRARRS